MMETVTKVNGYAVTRYAGERGKYFVNIWTGDAGSSEFHIFKTIKAARTFCESLPECSVYINQLKDN